MTKKEIQEELIKLQRLLKKEKDEDLKQYKERMKSASLTDRRKQGVCWYPVQLDKSKYSSTEQFMVKVLRNEEHREGHLFQSGKLVSLFSNAGQGKDEEDAVQGIVNNVREHEMIITLSTDEQPDWLNDGKLGVQLLFDENSYREMEFGLKKLQENVDERIEEFKSILLGNVAARFSSRHAVELPELNPSQNEALNLILSAKDLAIVHGPPGTGKTTTLVQGIIQTLKKETQVLVCAPSNAAVDLLAEKLGHQNIDVVRIGNPARVTDEIVNKTLDAKITKHEQYKELKLFRRTAEECRSQALKFKRNFGAAERQQRRELLAEAKQYRLEARMLADYIKEDVLNRTRVILTTLVGANNSSIAKKEFSTVFIDEAAQGLEPATWLPILKSKRVILAGDHHQLPPTVKSFEAAKEGLSQTLFEKAISRNRADVMLSEQYRMHRDIMNFSSQYFYKGQLIANSLVADWRIMPEDLPIEFVDTAGCGFAEQIHPETRSSLNEEELQVLFMHFDSYMESLAQLNLTDEVNGIGIISPYKAQVNRMQEIMREKRAELPDEPVITANTIDSFQGQERDIIYISLVRSNEKREIGFLKDIRRMNVAMTRARKKLVIIGDSATICSHPFYNAFFDYVNEIGGYRSAFEFIG